MTEPERFTISYAKIGRIENGIVVDAVDVDKVIPIPPFRFDAQEDFVTPQSLNPLRISWSYSSVTLPHFDILTGLLGVGDDLPLRAKLTMMSKTGSEQVVYSGASSPEGDSRLEDNRRCCGSRCQLGCRQGSISCERSWQDGLSTNVTPLSFPILVGGAGEDESI